MDESPLAASNHLEAPTTTTNDDFGDFGDFQTFDSSSESTSTNKNELESPSTDTSGSITSSPSRVPKCPNIYEWDMFQFQEFLTNFEEQLVELFNNSECSNNPQQRREQKSTSSSSFFETNGFSTTRLDLGPMSPIHSQEDIINDCP